jgi:hypothetical protein
MTAVRAVGSRAREWGSLAEAGSGNRFRERDRGPVEVLAVKVQGVWQYPSLRARQWLAGRELHDQL